MSVTVGIGGVRRNISAALSVDGRLLAACPQERLTRSRGIGSIGGDLPTEAVKAVLALGHPADSNRIDYATAETGLRFPSGSHAIALDHHHAHAAAAFYTSDFAEATVLVCDQHAEPELTVWSAGADGLQRLDFPWRGPAFARLYSQALDVFGFRAGAEEYKLEALARVGRHDEPGERYAGLVRLCEDQLTVDPGLQAKLAEWSRVAAGDRVRQLARIAYGFQYRLGELLVTLLDRVRKTAPSPNLCLAGGLFYNHYFNGLVQAARIFGNTFVPTDPGNPGLAVGSAMAAQQENLDGRRREAVSPFLGPCSSSSEIKTVLDNCKLSYSLMNEDRLLEQAVDALANGYLVGWFHGRMEWGPRALGNRSILASPLSPYVSENLNVFLKHRDTYRPYGVSVCQEDASEYFEGEVVSPFMEREYRAVDPERFAGLTPLAPSPVRVQTVGRSPVFFRQLLKAFGDKTGVPVLVNTSFNGFREPIVCSPRDAVRVFYGTGLDLLVLDRFVLRK